MTTTFSDAPGIASAAQTPRSAVAWGAIFGGAAVAAAVSLALMILGAGFGLTIVSPWSNSGVSAGTFAVTTAVGLVVIQWIASGLGGYITGRLRIRWVGIHTDEVFFRDTAHGFLAWCVSTLLVAVLLASIAFGTASTGVQAGATVASGAAQGATAAVSASAPGDPTGYFVDQLFRPPPGSQAAPADRADARQEVTRIMVNGAATGTLPAADKSYLAQIVASRTGLSQADAEKRVNDVVAQIDAAAARVKQAADAARKAGLATAFATFLSLLIGAFIAAVSAALGGRLRDDPQLVR
ncbi:hypothetical protein ACFW16_31575 [Inquilinus sp. NPDC058860]|uniref:hypothetical protein n=1 Tax=Inquilinus sp. NPDC058860 TaxID=3346652 RepID=UPI0036A4FC9A